MKVYHSFFYNSKPANTNAILTTIYNEYHCGCNAV